jgi:hypothetical protein
MALETLLVDLGGARAGRSEMAAQVGVIGGKLTQHLRQLVGAQPPKADRTDERRQHRLLVLACSV